MRKTNIKNLLKIFVSRFRVFLAGKSQLLRAILGLVFLGIFIYIASDSSISADFADSVLRPTIGDQNTIFLESLLFNSEDYVNQIEYKLLGENNQFNGYINSNNQLSASTSRLDLTPLAIINKSLPPFAGEGQWQTINLKEFPSQVVMAKTAIRPDLQRPYAVVSVVQIDMKNLNISAVAGTKDPGGPGHRGPGVIPSNIVNGNLLVAGFNGGFQGRDGGYGMIVGDKTYLPLKKNLATLIIDKDSNINILNYHGQELGRSNKVIRQNGGMLIENSQIKPVVDDNQYNIWGRTVTNSMYTWRSGVGITQNGNLLYAAGSSLIPETLSKALLNAGAVNAMQLDINPYWVRFVFFSSLGNGRYQHYSLLKNMYDAGEQFLHGDQKDFFYIYK